MGSDQEDTGSDQEDTGSDQVDTGSDQEDASDSPRPNYCGVRELTEYAQRTMIQRSMAARIPAPRPPRHSPPAQRYAEVDATLCRLASVEELCDDIIQQASELIRRAHPSDMALRVEVENCVRRLARMHRAETLLIGRSNRVRVSIPTEW